MPAPPNANRYFNFKPLAHNKLNHNARITREVLKFGCRIIQTTIPSVYSRLLPIQVRLLSLSIFFAKKSDKTRMTTIFANSDGWMRITPVSNQRAEPYNACPAIVNAPRKIAVMIYIGRLMDAHKW